jgi:hypothetical protein
MLYLLFLTGIIFTYFCLQPSEQNEKFNFAK